ncbi:MAG TPA: pitrilysin family protein [Dehalococcoidia bacterium]|nr:pitrilysin family protein [Dehalococcoidia bacterium]
MYQKTTLDNGLRIVTSMMPHTRAVCVSMFIGAGSRYELPEQAGVSHFVEHLCFKGTEKRPTAKEISETIDCIGGVLNGGTDKELTVYWVKVARPHFSAALDLLVDMLRNSKFDPVEIENERKVIIEELKMSMDSPQGRVDTLIDEVVWPNQALGRDVAGTKETVSIVNREMMLDYLPRLYLPSNTVVSVAGDISHEEVVSSVSRMLGNWPDGIPASWFPAENTQESPRLRREQRKTEQVHFCLTLRGLDNMHPDRFILDLLNVILGEGMSSRLFLELRERKGLAYDVHSHVNYYRDSGSLSIYAGVDPKKLESAIDAIIREIVRLRDEPIPEAELVKAKEMGKGRLLLRMEDTRSVAGWMGGQELLTNQIFTLDEVIEKVDAVTVENMRRLASELFLTSKINFALVGPVRNTGKLEKLLKL